jgi:hypothetical protein
MSEIAERALEDAIVRVLVAGRMNAAPETEHREPRPGFGEYIPGGYHQRSAVGYDRALCPIRDETIDSILATQLKTWAQQGRAFHCSVWAWQRRRDRVHGGTARRADSCHYPKAFVGEEKGR